MRRHTVCLPDQLTPHSVYTYVYAYLAFCNVVAQVYLLDFCQRIIRTSHIENLSKWLSWYNFVSSCIQVRNHGNNLTNLNMALDWHGN